MIDVKLKGPANEGLLQGYPGVAATWPRLGGTVEIRLLPSAKEEVRPINIVGVTIALYRTDSIVVPSHRPSVASQKREKSFLVTRQKEIYKNNGTKAVYGLDVPFTLSFPTKNPVTASISLPKTLESSYNAIVGIEVNDLGTPVVSNYQFPVRVRRFDTLRTFGAYKQPIASELPSSDHLVSLEWALPVSAYGPGDQITVSLKAQPNRDWPKSKKVKLKRFSIELVQKTRYNIPAPANSSPTKQVEEDEVSDTRTRISKTAREFTSAEQEARVGIESSVSVVLQTPVAYQSEEKDGVLVKEQPWVGYDGRNAFTNSCSLYNIEFVLVLKARFSHAKDIEAEQPITMSQFDHTACVNYMSSLMESAQSVKHLDIRPHPPREWTESFDTKIRIV